MSDAIIVALIGLAGSGIGSLFGIMVSNKLTDYRLAQLEKKVEAHNNLIERTYKLEKQEELLKNRLEEHEKLFAEKIKVANHRIDDLEGNHHDT